jgi:hypothetical protein
MTPAVLPPRLRPVYRHVLAVIACVALGSSVGLGAAAVQIAVDAPAPRGPVCTSTIYYCTNGTVLWTDGAASWCQR